MNCLAYLGLDFDEIAVMTMREYQLRMEAYQLRKAEKMHDMAVMAMFNREAKAQRKSGKGTKYVHRSPDEIFDLEKAVGRIRGNFEPEYLTEQQEKNIMLERLKTWRKLERRKHNGNGRYSHP